MCLVMLSLSACVLSATVRVGAQAGTTATPVSLAAASSTTTAPRRTLSFRDRLEDGFAWTALYVSPRASSGSPFRLGVQVLPTFAFGVPLATPGPQNEAARAVLHPSFFGGFFLRVSPIGFWGSVHGFLGTAEVQGAATLPEASFQSPAILVYGVGLDALGGILGVSWCGVSLRQAGFFGPEAASTNFVRFELDFGAMVSLVAGTIRAVDPR